MKLSMKLSSTSLTRPLLTLGLVMGLLMGLPIGGPAMAASVDMAPEKELEGTIQALDFGANTLIFEGTRFQMGVGAQVEIRGTYGAFTMLREGMKAVLTYRLLSESERVVTRIVQLPDNYSLEGA